MNLPLINTDNVGNSYYGWRTNNLIYAPDAAGFTVTQCANWINGFFGQTCAINNQGGLQIILPTSFESLTLPVTTTKARFFNNSFSATKNDPTDAISSSIIYRWNQNNSVSLNINRLGFGDNNRVFYAVLNNKSLNIFSILKNGENINALEYGFVSIGWLSNPLYSGNTFPRNAYYFFLFFNGNFVSADGDIRASGRPSAENTTVLQYFETPTGITANPIANYPVSCQTATPGANTTELYLRNNTSPHKAIGYVPNLLKTSLQIPVGQVYRNTGIDPDGSNMNTWICVGVFGSERILMRVWAQGLN